MRNERKLQTTTRVRHFGSIALGLLEGCECRAIGLWDGLAQVLVDGFLLDEHLGGDDIGIDERGVRELHLILESDDVVRIIHSKHIVEQFEPERLALTLLVTTVLPLLSKRLCRYLLLAILHDGMI